MKRGSKILAGILGSMIVIVSIMLVIAPFMKQEELHQEQDKKQNIANKTENDSSSLDENTNSTSILSEKITNIQLGVNSLIDGEGAQMRGQDIVINKGGTYNLSGTLLGATLYIETNEKTTLNLENVTIRSTKEGINITSAPVIINLVGNNTVNGGIEPNYDAAVLSSANITIEGEGNLTITSASKGISAEKIDYTGNSLTILAMEESPEINTNNDKYITNFILESPLNEGEKVILMADDENIAAEFISSGNYKNITLSTNKIKEGNYYLVKEVENKKENIIINGEEIYHISEKKSFFKSA